MIADQILINDKTLDETVTEIREADLIARARKIAPTLVERQAETEDRGYYAEDTHELFKEAGLYRCYVPKAFGGYGFGMPTFVEMVSSIASGCTSTGWQLCLGAGHALTVATFYSPEVQAELFGDGHFVAASTAKPVVVAKKLPSGDWLLNGTSNFASGSPYSTHFLGYAVNADAPQAPPMTYVAPRSVWKLLDDWGNILGLRGSGSNSVRFEDAVIPARYVLPEVNAVSAGVDGGTVSSTFHDNPLYAGRQRSAYAFEACAIWVGILRTAVEIYGDLMKERATIMLPNVPRWQNEDFLRFYGELLVQLDVVETLCQASAVQWMEAARANVAGTANFTPVVDLRLAALAGEVSKLCWDAISNILLPSVGPRDLTLGSRLTRLYRDASMARAHPISSTSMGAAQRMIATATLT